VCHKSHLCQMGPLPQRKPMPDGAYATGLHMGPKPSLRCARGSLLSQSQRRRMHAVAEPQPCHPCMVKVRGSSHAHTHGMRMVCAFGRQWAQGGQLARLALTIQNPASEARWRTPASLTQHHSRKHKRALRCCASTLVRACDPSS